MVVWCVSVHSDEKTMGGVLEMGLALRARSYLWARDGIGRTAWTRSRTHAVQNASAYVWLLRIRDESRVRAVDGEGMKTRSSRPRSAAMGLITCYQNGRCSVWLGRSSASVRSLVGQRDRG